MSAETHERVGAFLQHPVSDLSFPHVKQADSVKNEQLEAAARARREADLKLSMSERLARLQDLSKQLSSIRRTGDRRP